MNNIEDIIGDQSTITLFAKCDKNCYGLFASNVRKHFNKFPNEQVKDILNPLILHDLIKIGSPEKNNKLLLGQVVRTVDNKIAGIVVNHITHDIDFDGNSLSFDKIIASIYYVFIEYSIRKLFFEQACKDKLLLQRLSHYFEYILVKNLKLFELYQDKRVLFNFLVKLFFYTHVTKMNINMSYELAMSPGDETLITNTLDINKLAKYSSLNSLYDALYDFNIISMTPNNMKYMLTNSIGIFAYINLHANISSMVASIIISKYKHQNFAQLFISTDMINAVEKIIIDGYLQRVPFDFEAFNRVINNAINNNLNSLKTVV